ncbi:MAG: hypothetical protein IH864_04240 [Chloroflexi bacterium]|nr:hypothetical protein [Chloroflexota bacterium]
MSEFRFVYWLSPEGPFGIPEAGVTVVPGGQKQIVGDVYDSWTGRKVSHGAQTMARSPDDKVQLTFEVEGTTVRLDDNYLKIHPEAETAAEAERIVAAILRRFLAAFSFHQGQFFQARLVQATGEKGLLAEMMHLGKFTVFSLEGIRGAASAAAQWIPDLQKKRRLDMALEYFNRALYLRRSELEARLDLPFLWGASSLRGEAFLNYWKSITAVLGDPSKEGKRFQLFYKKLGIDRSLIRTDVKRLSGIRNDYDVAHSLGAAGGNAFSISDEDINLAERMAKLVMQSYYDLLKGQPDVD